MRASLRTSLALLAAALLAACGGGGSKPTPAAPVGGSVVAANCSAGPASLEGTFKAPNGTTPVGAANVTISTAGGCVATTNAAGNFKFNGVPATIATVTATKGNFVVSASATPGTPVALVIPPGSVKLAYVWGSFDSIQTILTDLGFAPVGINASDLATMPQASFDQYDAIFLNCGLDDSVLSDPDFATSTTGAIAAYVAQGGALYASDWAATFVDATFPGKVVFIGAAGDPTDSPVTAQILDAALRTAIGASTAQIMFDLGAWYVIDSVGSGVTTLISGPVTYGGPPTTKPFAVQFVHGAGRVTYTSFHNEAQVTGDMQKLLESMVFGL